MYYRDIFTLFNVFPFFCLSHFLRMWIILSRLLSGPVNDQELTAHCRERLAGGVGLPNLIGYYWATNTHKLLLWCTSPQTSWFNMQHIATFPVKFHLKSGNYWNTKGLDTNQTPFWMALSPTSHSDLQQPSIWPGKDWLTFICPRK